MKLHQRIIFKLVLLLPFLFQSFNLAAQSDHTARAYPTRTFAITNATIIPAPGELIENGSVVISNGLISEIGTDVSIPDDAEVIDGTDLYVYPGFIDGLSNTGAKRPEPMERPDDLFSPDPPNDYAGITPEHNVLSQIDISDKSIESMRKQGFTISHSVPHGRMLPGSGSLLLLSEGKTTDDLILKQDISMFTQFSGAPGAYPGNTLGIMAKWRNLYRNALQNKRHEEMYAQNPGGMQRPPQNRVLQAFYPVVEQTQPVFYNTNSMLEARRAIKLKKELDFDLVLSDLEEGWFLLDDLKESDVKVMLSLNIPEKPKEMDEEDKTDEIEHLEKRRMEFYNQHLSQYSEFDESGIPFGFSTIGTSSGKIKGNLEALVEFGLSPDVALAALTINAAEILGIDNITGTLESGKLGNAVISTGPYFEKESKVKYVFVDGDKYELDTSKKASAETSAEAAAAIMGNWNYTITSPQGEQTGQMIFTEEGGSLAGTMTSDDGRPDRILDNVTFVEGTLSFDFSFDAGGQSVEIVVVGDVVDTEFIGEASIAAFNMSVPMTATKEPN